MAKALAALVTLVAWGGLAGLALARAAGTAPAPIVVAVSAALALAVALAHAGRSLARVFRGPPLVAFPRDRAALCEPEDAEQVRAAAQLRGSLGGAGHLHRTLLLLPFAAWAAAAVLAGEVLAAEVLVPGAEIPVWPLAILAPAAVASLRWRARPFHYREATGGWLVVHPPAAQDWIVRRGVGKRGRPTLRGVRLGFGGADGDGPTTAPEGEAAPPEEAERDEDGARR